MNDLVDASLYNLRNKRAYYLACCDLEHNVYRIDLQSWSDNK